MNYSFLRYVFKGNNQNFINYDNSELMLFSILILKIKERECLEYLVDYNILLENFGVILYYILFV